MFCVPMFRVSGRRVLALVGTVGRRTHHWADCIHAHIRDVHVGYFSSWLGACFARQGCNASEDAPASRASSVRRKSN